MARRRRNELWDLLVDTYGQDDTAISWGMGSCGYVTGVQSGSGPPAGKAASVKNQSTEMIDSTQIIAWQIQCGTLRRVRIWLGFAA